MHYTNDGDNSLLPGDPLRIEGWAAGPEEGAPLSRVELRIDGVAVGNATLGLLRPDVAAAFGRFEFVRSGWVLTVNVGRLVKGTHTVTAIAFDSEGNAALLSGEHSIQVVSPP